MAENAATPETDFIALKAAITFYEQQHGDVVDTAWRPSILSQWIREGGADAGAYFIISVTSGGGSSWVREFTSILRVRNAVGGAQPTVEDVTSQNLPSGVFQACFWVPNTNHNKAGRACFEVSSDVDKVWVRLQALGVYKRVIPWRRKNGTVTFNDQAPEGCDGVFGASSPTGWCPWHATLQGVYSTDLGTGVEDKFAKF